MRIEIPFSYKVEFWPPQKINPRSARFAAVTSVEIRDVPSRLARTAFRVGNTGAAARDRQARAFAAKPDGSLREVLRFDHAFYVETADAATLERLARELGDLSDTPFREAENSWLRADAPDHLKAVRAGDLGPVRRLEDDGGASAARRLQRIAQDCICIDGQLYVRCPEPALVIKDGRLAVGNFPFPSWDPLNHHYEWLDGHVEKARLDDTAFAARADGADCEVEVLLPEFCRGQPVAGKAARGIETLVGAVAKFTGEMPSEQISACIDLRDDLPSVSPASMAAVTLLRRFADIPAPSPAESERARLLAGRSQQGPFARGNPFDEACDAFLQAKASASRLADLIETGLLPSSWPQTPPAAAVSSENHTVRACQHDSEIDWAASALGFDPDAAIDLLRSDPDLAVLVQVSRGLWARPGSAWLIRASGERYAIDGQLGGGSGPLPDLVRHWLETAEVPAPYAPGSAP